MANNPHDTVTSRVPAAGGPSFPILLMVRALGQGGSERQLVEMAIALSKRGWQVHVACFEVGGIRTVDLESNGIPILNLQLRSFRSPSFLASLLRLARYRSTHRISVVHSFDYPSNFVAAAFGRLCGFQRIVTSQRSFRELRSPIWRRILRWTDQRADAIVINCEALRAHMVNEEGAPADRIHLCYNGLNSNRFPVREMPLEAAPVIGVVCALRPEKGLSFLLEAFSQISSRYPTARLLIVGSGPERERLGQLSMKLGIAARCDWHPSTGDVSPWLRRIDVFVLPSESEAFSNSLLEAMSSGCAVVSSATGGSPELVENERTGLLFPNRDVSALTACLDRLLNSPEKRTQLALAAAVHVRSTFTITHAASMLEKVYRGRTHRRG